MDRTTWTLNTEQYSVLTFSTFRHHKYSWPWSWGWERLKLDNAWCHHWILAITKPANVLSAGERHHRYHFNMVENHTDFLTFQDRSVMREQSCWRKEGRSAQAFSPSTWELFFGLQCPVHCCGISVKILWSIRYAPSWTIKLKAVSEKWEEVERRINGEEDGTSGHHHLLPLRRHSHLPWTEVDIICSLGRIQKIYMQVWGAPTERAWRDIWPWLLDIGEKNSFYTPLPTPRPFIIWIL